MLDKKMLTDMPPCVIFARGEIVDAPEGINMTNSGRMPNGLHAEVKLTIGQFIFIMQKIHGIMLKTVEIRLY